MMGNRINIQSRSIGKNKNTKSFFKCNLGNKYQFIEIYQFIGKKKLEII